MYLGSSNYKKEISQQQEITIIDTKAVEEMIFKSRSTSPLMEAVRETFDKFDMGRQAELRIFCGEEKAKEESTKEEKIKEESVLPVARSLLLTSSPLLRFSFFTIIQGVPPKVQC